MKKIIGVLFLAAVNILFISSCSKPNDQKAYEEVFSTMSMKKAKLFFENYPESKYRDRLVNEIIGWCKQEETEECYKMILESVPKDDSRYTNIVIYYKEHFDVKNINHNRNVKEGM